MEVDPKEPDDSECGANFTEYDVNEDLILERSEILEFLGDTAYGNEGSDYDTRRTLATTLSF